MSNKHDRNKQQAIEKKELGQLPPNIRSIKVNNVVSARRLLSRIICQFQRGEISNSFAKDMAYLLSQFIAIDKYIIENKSISEKMIIEIVKAVERTNVARDEIIEVLTEELGEETATRIWNKFSERISTNEKKVLQTLNLSIDKYKKQRSMVSSLINSSDINEIHDLIVNKCRSVVKSDLVNLINSLSKI